MDEYNEDQWQALYDFLRTLNVDRIPTQVTFSPNAVGIMLVTVDQFVGRDMRIERFAVRIPHSGEVEKREL